VGLIAQATYSFRISVLVQARSQSILGIVLVKGLWAQTQFCGKETGFVDQPLTAQRTVDLNPHEKFRPTRNRIFPQQLRLHDQHRIP